MAKRKSRDTSKVKKGETITPDISDGTHVNSSVKNDTKERILYRIMRNAQRARSVMIREGRELNKFMSRRRGPDNEQFNKIDYWNAKVARTDEALEIFGPYLYQQTPSRIVTPEDGISDEALFERPALEKLLNKSQLKTRTNRHNKRAVRNSVNWGRGIVKSGLSRLGFATSKWLHPTDFLEDPDATIPEQVTWQSGRRFVKRFKLRAEIPSKAAVINDLTKYTDMNSDVNTPENSTGKYDDDLNSNGNSSGNIMDEQRFYHTPEDLIEVYDVYMTVGLSNFRDGRNAGNIENVDGTRSDLNTGDRAEPVRMDDSPRKYTVAWQHGNVVLLKESDWEIPFWITREFPFSKLELVEDDELMIPKSVLLPGIGWQRAMNEIVQLGLSKARFNLRDIFIILKKFGLDAEEDEWQKLIDGDDQEVITISSDNPNAKVKDVIEQLQPKEMSSEFERILAVCMENYQRATGLYDILYTGQTATQARSASESKIRQNRSLSRIEEMRFRVQEWADEVAQKEAFASRFLLDREDVVKLIGEKLGSRWRNLVPPIAEHIAEVTARIQEQFPDVSVDDPLFKASVEQQVMIERSQGVTFDEWVNDYSVNIVSDSMRRKDRQEQIALSDVLMNQSLPALAQIGTPQAMQLVGAIFVQSMEARGADGPLLELSRKMAQGMSTQVNQQQQQQNLITQAGVGQSTQ